MEFEHLIKLINTVSASNLTCFRYEASGIKLRMQKGSGRGETSLEETEQNFTNDAAVHSVTEASLGSDSGVSAEPSQGNVITSPLVGTYYCAPSEGAEPFVSVGDSVKTGQTLAIIEAMKLMNEIESEYSGTVAEIFVKNGQPVEYGQPLFRIKGAKQ